MSNASVWVQLLCLKCQRDALHNVEPDHEEDKTFIVSCQQPGCSNHDSADDVKKLKSFRVIN